MIVAIGDLARDLIAELREMLPDASPVESLVVTDMATGRPASGVGPTVCFVSSHCGGTGSHCAPDLAPLQSPVTPETVAQVLRHQERLYHISPDMFESFVAELYRGLGFTVTQTKRSRDGGVDLYLTKNIYGMRHVYLVQCKHSARSSRRIGVGVARELLGTALDKGATAAIMITNVLFTADALKLATRHAARLFCVDRNGLCELMRLYLQAKT